MTLLLFRQDAALRTLFVTLPLSAGAGLLIRVASTDDWLARIGNEPIFRWHGGIVTLAVTVWLMFLFFLVTAGFWSRGNRLHLALPLASRKLWLVRMAAVLTAVLLPLAAVTAGLALRFQAATSLPSLDLPTLGTGFRFAGWLVLSLALFQLPRPGLARIPVDGKYLLFIVVATPLLILGTVFSPAAAVYGLAPLALAVLLGVRIWFTLPATLWLAPTRLPAGSPHGQDTRDPEGLGHAAIIPPGVAGSRRILHFTALRILSLHPFGLLFLPLLALESGIATAYFLSGRSHFLYSFFSIMFLWAMIANSIYRLRAVDHLPVSRKYLFRFSLLPGMVVLLAAVGIVFVIAVSFPEDFTQLRSGRQVRVPAEFWRLSPDGDPPPVDSPWGETWKPRTYPLLREGGPSAYNPFGHGPENSAAFARLQTARAALAVHDIPIPGELLRPETEMIETAAADRRDCCVIPYDAIGRASPVRNRVLALSLLLFGAGTSILFHLSMRVFRFSRLKPLYGALFPSVAIVITAVLVGSLVGQRFGFSSLEALDAYLSVGLRHLAEFLGLGTPALWALVVLAYLGGYFLIRNTYLKAEATSQKKPRFLGEYSF